MNSEDYSPYFVIVAFIAIILTLTLTVVFSNSHISDRFKEVESKISKSNCSDLFKLYVNDDDLFNEYDSSKHLKDLYFDRFDKLGCMKNDKV